MDNPSKVGTFIPVGAALVGLVALIVAIFALTRANRAASQADQIPGLVERLDSAEGSIASVRSTSDTTARAVNTGMTQMRDQTQKAFDSVGNELAALRTQINSLTIEVKESATRRPAPAAAPAATGGSGGSTRTTPTAGPGEYIVQPGDTFSKIAKEAGVSLSDLEKANPGVDSRRLRIGQKIALPGRN